MHTIRLRGQWEMEPLEREQLRCTRRFHCPTGLDDSSRVWLVIDDLNAAAEVTLNDQPLQPIVLPPATAVRYDITAALKPGNLLAIRLTSPQGLESVRLEIDEGVGERGASGQ